MADQRKGKNTAAVCEELAIPILKELGLSMWDVRYEKEGSVWYLRYYLDKDGGIAIADLEKANRALDKALDEADPIAGSYMLEVSSPGLERQLTRDWHYEFSLGREVQVRMIRPVDGVRDFIGVLARAEGGLVTVLYGENHEHELVFDRKESAYIRWYEDFELEGAEE